MPVKHYGQLIAGGNPFFHRAPAFFEISDRQEDQLRCRILGWECALGFERFAQHPV